MKNLEKEFIPYEQALALKELGFDEPCLKVIEGGPTDIFPYEKLDVPLYQQTFRWFRKKYGIHSWIINAEDNGNVFKPFFRMKTGKDIFDQHMIDWYESYEEAELDCLIKLIEIVENEKNI